MKFTILILLSSVFALAAYAKQEPRTHEEWGTHDDLALKLGCSFMLYPAATRMVPVGGRTPPVAVHPYPEGILYPARTLLNNTDANSEFLIGWEPRTPDSFQYRVKAMPLAVVSTEAIRAGNLAFHSHRQGDASVAQIQVVLDTGAESLQAIITQKKGYSVSLDDTDFTKAITGRFTKPVKSFSVWIYHPNANPPLASEIEDVLAAARMALTGNIADKHITLHVVGPFELSFIRYTVEIPFQNDGRLE